MKLIVWLQIFLPLRFLSSIVHTLARLRWGGLVHFLIRRYVRFFDVNLAESEKNQPEDFDSFNAFFTRSLKPGARTIDHSPRAIASPVDGRVFETGQFLDGDRVVAKGRGFSLNQLLGGEFERSSRFMEGQYATLYLSPGDYHRIHMPIDGRLAQMIYIPGRLFSVHPESVNQIENVFARNERVVLLFETEHGPMIMVLVGALFVGSIECTWAGEVTKPRGSRIEVWDYEDKPELKFSKGDEIARFNMGSTVVLILSDLTFDWEEWLTAGSCVQVGQAIASRKKLSTI